MKMIIAGGREFIPTRDDYKLLVSYLPLMTEICSGMARGADTFAMWFGKHHKIPVKEFPADWTKFGRRAGPIRNKEMAVYAEGCILFPGGNGTNDMFRQAKSHNLQIFDHRIKNSTLDTFFD